MKNQLVFLGGTCGKNDWRLGLIERLIARGVPAEALFNPVVPNWDAAAQANEDRAKAEATVMLYYLGNPNDGNNNLSFYSLLEATMGLYDAPGRTVVVFDATDMPKHAAKATAKAFKDLKARFPDLAIFDNLAIAEDWINFMTKPTAVL